MASGKADLERSQIKSGINLEIVKNVEEFILDSFEVGVSSSTQLAETIRLPFGLIFVVIPDKIGNEVLKFPNGEPG